MHIAIEIPTCIHCSDWMAPVLMVEHPVQAAVWICAGCRIVLMHGFAHPNDLPDRDAQHAFAKIACHIATEHEERQG
jgi:hypothetical protein